MRLGGEEGGVRLLRSVGVLVDVVRRRRDGEERRTVELVGKLLWIGRLDCLSVCLVGGMGVFMRFVETVLLPLTSLLPRRL
jgi:hypothetical protein